MPDSDVAVRLLSHFADTEVALSLTTSWSGRPTGIAVADEADLAWAVWGADGNVGLAPGEVDDLRIDGALWRVTVIAAYQEEPPGGHGDGRPELRLTGLRACS